MITLKQLQAELKIWQEHNFPNRESYRSLLGMGEELGELNHHFLKRLQKIRLNEDHDAGIKDSIADLLIFACDFCNAEGIDLEVELEKTWAQVKQRDWKANKNTGKLQA